MAALPMVATMALLVTNPPLVLGNRGGERVGLRVLGVLGLGGEEVREGANLVDDGAGRAKGAGEEAAGGSVAAHAHVFSHNPLCGGV